MNSRNIRKTGEGFWLGTPYDFGSRMVYIRYVDSGGYLSHTNTASGYRGVRPAISLVPGTKYSSGNGSMANPYIVSDYISNTRFSDGPITGTSRDVTITFPSGCGTTLTCSYKKDNGSSINVTTTSVVVNFNSVGTLSTIVSDDIVTLTNSHIVKLNALYVSSSGNDSTGNGSITTPYKTISKAYNMADDNSTIYIMNNLTVTETTVFDSNKNITLTSCTKSGSNCPVGSANSIIRGSSFGDRIFTISDGTINLSTITINGNNVSATATMIYNDSTLNLNSGTTIQNGNKTGNEAGAIYSRNNLNITDATISNNHANNNGGAIYNYGGTVVINSVTMKNNSVTANGGGALYNSNSGTVTISSGTFESNSAKYGGALYNLSGTMTINGGNFYKNSSTYSGGVLHAYGTVNITGGTFGGSSANANTADGGGAIRIPNNDAHGRGTINMSGGTISYNTSNTKGGGISNAGTLNLSGTAKISYNSAGTHGGGVMCDGEKCIFNMTAGEISYNTSTEQGGGVDNDGVSTITGGKITNNTASGTGGGVYNATTGTLKYNNTVTVKSNTSVNNYSYNTATVGKFMDQKGGYTTTNSGIGTVYHVVSKKDNAYVVDVESGTGTATNGTNVHLWKKGTSGTNSRKWKILPDTVENGVVYYHFESQANSDQSTKKVMDNTSNSSTSGNNVQVYAWGSGNGERWSLKSAGSGYFDIKTYTGLCLDIQSGTMADGTNIRGYTCNSSDAQRWKFTKA